MLEYLEESRKGKPLLPKDSASRAKVNAIE